MKFGAKANRQYFLEEQLEDLRKQEEEIVGDMAELELELRKNQREQAETQWELEHLGAI